LPQIESYKGY